MKQILWSDLIPKWVRWATPTLVQGKICLVLFHCCFSFVLHYLCPVHEWNAHVGTARKSSLFGHMINSLLTKLVWSTWLDIGLILFRTFVDLDFPLLHKTRKESLASIQQSWSGVWSICYLRRKLVQRLLESLLGMRQSAIGQLYSPWPQ